MANTLIYRVLLKPAKDYIKKLVYTILQKTTGLSRAQIESKIINRVVKLLQGLLGLTAAIASYQGWIAFTGLMATNPVGAIVFASILGLLTLSVIGYLVYSVVAKKVFSLKATDTLAQRFRALLLSKRHQQLYDRTIVGSRAYNESIKQYEKIVKDFYNDRKESLGVDIEEMKKGVEDKKKGAKSIKDTLDENKELIRIVNNLLSVLTNEKLEYSDRIEINNFIYKTEGIAGKKDLTCYENIGYDNSIVGKLRKYGDALKDFDNQISKNINKLLASLMNQDQNEELSDENKSNAIKKLLTIGKIYTNKYIIYGAIKDNRFAEILQPKQSISADEYLKTFEEIKNKSSDDQLKSINEKLSSDPNFLENTIDKSKSLIDSVISAYSIKNKQARNSKLFLLQKIDSQPEAKEVISLKEQNTKFGNLRLAYKNDTMSENEVLNSDLASAEIKKWTQKIESLITNSNDLSDSCSRKILFKLLKAYINHYHFYKKIQKDISSQAINNEEKNIPTDILQDAFTLQEILSDKNRSTRYEKLSALLIPSKLSGNTIDSMSHDKAKVLYLLLDNSFGHVFSTNKLMEEKSFENRFSYETLVSVINSEDIGTTSSIADCIRLVHSCKELLSIEGIIGFDKATEPKITIHSSPEAFKHSSDFPQKAPVIILPQKQSPESESLVLGSNNHKKQ